MESSENVIDLPTLVQQATAEALQHAQRACDVAELGLERQRAEARAAVQLAEAELERQRAQAAHVVGLFEADLARARLRLDYVQLNASPAGLRFAALPNGVRATIEDAARARVAAAPLPAPGGKSARKLAHLRACLELAGLVTA